jgi:hypothetical protein
MVEPHRHLPYNHRLRRKRRAFLERRLRQRGELSIRKFDFLRRYVFVGLPLMVFVSVWDGVVEDHEQLFMTLLSLAWLIFLIQRAFAYWQSRHAPVDSELEKIDAEIVEEVSRLRQELART